MTKKSKETKRIKKTHFICTDDNSYRGGRVKIIIALLLLVFALFSVDTSSRRIFV